MPSEILGLFTTPEQYQQNQLAQVRNRAFQEVQLNPFQQAALGARTAGYQLGQAIGGALGGQDPQLQMISRRQQLASQLDPSDPQSYMRVAKIAADAGDQQFAMAIADAGREASVKVAQANKERQLAVPAKIQELQMIPQLESAIAKLKAGEQTPEIAQQISSLQRMLSVIDPAPKPEKMADRLQIAQRVREIETQLSPDAGVVLPPQIIAGLQSELANLKEEQKQNISKVGVSKVTGETVYYDENQNLQYVVKTDPKDPTKQIRSPFTGSVDQTTSNVNQTASSKQAAGINQNKLDFAKAIEENAFSASDRISLAQSLRELSPKAFTGFAADAKLTASKVASAFGIPTKGGTESEIIDQILGQMTIGAAGQLKGALSDKDVLFLKKTIGTRGLSVNTLLFVADEIERLAAQDRHLNKRINQVTQSGGNLNEVNFEEEKSKSSSFVKKQMSEYRGILKKVANNTATLEEATKARQIRDELGL